MYFKLQLIAETNYKHNGFVHQNISHHNLLFGVIVIQEDEFRANEN